MKINLTKNYKHEIASIITAGFPFVVYKTIMGHLAYTQLANPFCYIAFVFWFLALVDFIINFLNFVFLIFKGKPFTDVCFLAFLFNFFKPKHKEDTDLWYHIGTAFDAMLSFSIVALVVGFNFFVYFVGHEVYFWNIATVFNVIGAGFFQVKNALINLKK
ncbi:MAG: hypothetical protein AB7U85_06170 [Alphaproteobacteria bacterium]